jgi:hypothetical protein
MTTKEGDLCVDCRDSNRTCLHVDLVRDCRRRRSRRRQAGEEEEDEEEEEEEERKKSFQFELHIPARPLK